MACAFIFLISCISCIKYICIYGCRKPIPCRLPLSRRIFYIYIKRVQSGGRGNDLLIFLNESNIWQNEILRDIIEKKRKILKIFYFLIKINTWLRCEILAHPSPQPLPSQFSRWAVPCIDIGSPTQSRLFLSICYSFSFFYIQCIRVEKLIILIYLWRLKKYGIYYW